MNENKNSNLTNKAQALRVNMTKEEKHLWYDFLKKLPITINRQKVIGKYIADFYCAQAALIIEIDGRQHYEPEARSKDAERTKYLQNKGIEIIRYTNGDINKNFQGVCEDIQNRIALRLNPSSVSLRETPSPKGEG